MSSSGGRGYVATAPTARDPRLRGRTYAVPFEDVWQAAMKLAGGGLRRWSLREADDDEGVIYATATSVAGAYHDIMITISLDENGQTRVDGSALARKPLTDFGRSARRLRRLFRALDKSVERPPARASRDTR